jgi:hypothetical protein
VSRWRKVLYLLLVTPLLAAGAARAELQFEALQSLPPGEQFRRLELMRLVSASVAPELRSALLAATPETGSAFDPDRYTTPLARIVDQPSLLAGAARLFRFTQLNDEEILARMAELETANPVLISLLDDASLLEDAVLIRTAIADGMEFSGLLEPGEMMQESLRTYRVHTLYLRNVMEFQDFDEQLDRLTDQAIASVGGKLDAYQRMFDEEMISEQLDRQIESAESIYRDEEEFDPRAGELTEELIESMIRMEASPKP